MATDDPAVASLTTREREVATLAAAGCSNAETAERLGLAVRTAEGHLAKAMTKLGVSRRTELAERLHGHEARVNA
jgi:DNA-binding CsgD family transcriptional regulator